MQYFLLTIFYLGIPLLINYLTKRFKILNKIGVVLICYIIGLMLGHSGFIPKDSEKLQNDIVSASVLIAIPLLLFESSIRSWFRTARPALLSMSIAVAALIITIFSGYFIFSINSDEGVYIGGLLAGLYTGGTPNLAAISRALNVSNSLYISIHTFDTFLGIIYLMILFSFGKNFFRWFLPSASKKKSPTYENVSFKAVNFRDWIKMVKLKSLLYSFGAAIIVAGVSAAFGLLFYEDYQMTIIILTLSTLSLIISSFKFASTLKGSFDLGMYFIYVFSITVSSQANFAEILSINSNVYLYVSYVLFITFALHILGRKLIGVDSDTTIVVRTALICSPPFVPVIAGNLKNKDILVPGITIGIIGYAIGNYLGIFIASILHQWL